MNTQSQHLLADLRHRERQAAAACRVRRAAEVRLLSAGHPLEPADIPVLLAGRRAPRWWAALEIGRLAPDRRALVRLVGGRAPRPSGPDAQPAPDREPERTNC